MKNLANFIMVRYYIVNELEIDDLDLSEKEVELVKKALQETGSIEELKNKLDEYIKLNDFTGYLGQEGSGNRERKFAIEASLDYAKQYLNETNRIGETNMKKFSEHTEDEETKMAQFISVYGAPDYNGHQWYITLHGEDAENFGEDDYKAAEEVGVKVDEGYDTITLSFPGDFEDLYPSSTPSSPYEGRSNEFFGESKKEQYNIDFENIYSMSK